MTSNKQFRVRRAIVRGLYDYTCGQDLDTILCTPEMLLENPSPELALTEWNALIDGGFLIPLPGYNGMVCRLADHVRLEMDSSHGALPHHVFLYGPRVM